MDATSPPPRPRRRRPGARSRKLIAGSATTAFVGVIGAVAATDPTEAGSIATVPVENLAFVEQSPTPVAAPPFTEPPSTQPPAAALPTPTATFQGLVFPTPTVNFEGLVFATPTPVAVTKPAVQASKPAPTKATETKKTTKKKKKKGKKKKADPAPEPTPEPIPEPTSGGS